MGHRFAAILLLLISFNLTVFSQEGGEVKISTIKENIDGKEFYLHFVQSKQTIYSICRAYNISKEELIVYNPEVTNGLEEGHLLSIPVILELDKRKDELLPEQEDNFFYHIIKHQETLYGLSRKYGVSIESIKEMNPDLGDYPKIGQTLKIPKIAKDVSGEWDDEMKKHIVQQGETLYQIANIYGVTVGQIKNANVASTDTLKIGQALFIPQETEKKDLVIEAKKDTFLIEHTVQAKETLYSLARRYAVNIDTIRSYNPGLLTNIQIGEVLLIPDAKTTKANFIFHRNNETTRLKNIAEIYEVEVDELMHINPGIRKKVKSGEMVKIPVDEKRIEQDIEIDNDSLIVDPSFEELFPCKHVYKHKKSFYNVALMIPLYLEETDLENPINEYGANKLSELNSLRFLQFYQGLLLAADSLSRHGMKINLFVYDVDNSDEKILKVLSASELSQMDLIIGPFYKKSFEQVSSYANLFGIKIINPLSTRKEVILNNPVVFKVQPDENKISELIVNQLKNCNDAPQITIVRKTQYKFQKEVDYLKENLQKVNGYYILNEDLSAMIANSEVDEKTLVENKIIDPTHLKLFPKDSTYFRTQIYDVVFKNYDFSQLTNSLSPYRKNIIICYSEDKAFVKELIGRLNIYLEDYKFELYGLPHQKYYDEIETDFLIDLNYHSITASNINFDQEMSQNFISCFRKLYHTDPELDQYAFDGFDIGWYFFNALFHYGVNFEACIEGMKLPLIMNEFRFEQDAGHGFENKNWQLIKYDNYSILEEEASLP